MKRSLLSKLCVLTAAMLLASCSSGVAPESIVSSSSAASSSQPVSTSSNESKPTESSGETSRPAESSSAQAESSNPVESSLPTESSGQTESSIPEESSEPIGSEPISEGSDPFSVESEPEPVSSEAESEPESIESEASSEQSSPEEISSEEQPDLSMYQVSETYWTENITRFGYFGVNNNQMFLVEVLAGTMSMQIAEIANDNGKLWMKIGTGEDALEEFFIPNESGGYDIYEQGANGWEKGSVPAAYAAYVVTMFSSYLHPWAYSDFYFDTNSHNYLRVDGVVDTFNYGTEDEPRNMQVKNQVFSFENNKMLSLTYDLMSPEGQTSTMRVRGLGWGTTTVNPPELPPVIEATSLKLDQTKLELEPFESATLVATIEPENATNKDVEWESSNDKVAMVFNGVVYALSEGEATITARLGKLTATCEVTVRAAVVEPTNPFAGVSLTYVCSGEDGKGLAVEGYDADPTVYTQEWCEEYLSTITINFFDDGQKDAEGDIENGSFEVYSKNADGTLNYVLLGKYDSYIGDYTWADMEVETYYNAKTGKYFHGDHITKLGQPVLLFNGVGHDSETGLYDIGGYIGTNAGSGTGIIAKGPVYFQKASDVPTHLEGLPEDPHDDNYEAFLANKSFLFAGLTGTEGMEESAVTSIETAYQGGVLNFFEDGTFYLTYSRLSTPEGYANVDIIYRGEYSIDITDQGDLLSGDTLYAIDLYLNNMVMDGVEKSVYQSETAFFDSSKNEVRCAERYQKNNASGEIETLTYFSRFMLQKDIIPTPYVAPEIPDNWDATAVANALTSVGYTDMLPKLDKVKTTDIKSINAETGEIEIEAALVYGEMRTYNNYYSVLREAGFEYNYDSETGTISFLSPNEEYVVLLDLSTNSYIVKISIRPHVIYYPADEIAAYMARNSFTDPIIDFHVDSAKNYDWRGSYLSISLKPGTNPNSVVAGFKEALAAKGYIIRMYQGFEYVVSPNNQLMLNFTAVESDTEPIAAISFTKYWLPTNIYPADEVAEYLTGTTDPIPSFANAAVEGYKMGNDWYCYGKKIEAITPLDTDVVSIVEAFQSTLVTEMNYSANRTLTIHADDGDTVYENMYVSENRQIAISFSVFTTEEATQSHDNCTLYYVTILNLSNRSFTLDGDPISIEATDYTVGYYIDDEFLFDGEVTVYYEDGSYKVLDRDQFTVSEVDTSTVGEKEFTITATVDGFVLTTTGTILVEEPPVIEPQIVEYAFRCTDDANWLENNGASFKVWAWGGEHGEGEWLDVVLDNGLFLINAYDNAEGLILVRFNAGVDELEEFPIVWDETLDPYITHSSSNLLAIEAGETEYVEFSFGETPAVQSYTYRCGNNWDVTSDGAYFKVWAWGGEYGEGTWIDVRTLNRDGIIYFEFNAFNNAEGFKIVRFNPEVELPADWPDSINTYVWNQSGNLLSIEAGEGEIPVFSF